MTLTLTLPLPLTRCMDLRKALHAGCGASPDECISTEMSDRVQVLKLVRVRVRVGVRVGVRVHLD